MRFFFDSLDFDLNLGLVQLIILNTTFGLFKIDARKNLIQIWYEVYIYISRFKIGISSTYNFKFDLWSFQN